VILASCKIVAPSAANRWTISTIVELVGHSRPGDGEDFKMNYSRVVLAATGATVAYFVIGGLVFSLLPFLRAEFSKYPAIYRGHADIKRVMPVGMAAIFVSILVLSLIYAMLYRGGPGVWQGVYFGALIGIFVVCAFVLHNYVNLNIGLRITLAQAVAYFFEWTIVGMVIGLVYKPAA
jgi:hypothetical protein